MQGRQTSRASFGVLATHAALCLALANTSAGQSPDSLGAANATGSGDAPELFLNCNTFGCGEFCDGDGCASGCAFFPNEDTFDVSEVLSYEEVVDPFYLTACGRKCSGRQCAGACSGFLCGLNCEGPLCADRCIGPLCGQSCAADKCAVACTGYGCGSHCRGASCGAFCAGGEMQLEIGMEIISCAAACEGRGCGSFCTGSGCAQDCKGDDCGAYCMYDEGGDCAKNCKSESADGRCGQHKQQKNSKCGLYQSKSQCTFPNSNYECQWQSDVCGGEPGATSRVKISSGSGTGASGQGCCVDMNPPPPTLPPTPAPTPPCYTCGDFTVESEDDGECVCAVIPSGVERCGNGTVLEATSKECIVDTRVTNIFDSTNCGAGTAVQGAKCVAVAFDDDNFDPGTETQSAVGDAVGKAAEDCSGTKQVRDLYILVGVFAGLWTLTLLALVYERKSRVQQIEKVRSQTAPLVAELKLQRKKDQLLALGATYTEV